MVVVMVMGVSTVCEFELNDDDPDLAHFAPPLSENGNNTEANRRLIEG